MKHSALIITLILAFPGPVTSQISTYLKDVINVPAGKITSMVISRDDRFLCYGTNDGDIYVWDLNFNRQLFKLSQHSSEVSSLIIDSQNKYLISASPDKKVIIWDFYTREVFKIIPDNKIKVKKLALSPDEKQLAICGNSNSIMVYDFPSAFLKGELTDEHKKDPIFITFNKYGDQLVSLGLDKKIVYWDLNRFKSVTSFEISPNTISGSGFDVLSGEASHDKQILVTGIEEIKLAKGGNSMVFKYFYSFYNLEDHSEIKLLEGNTKKLEIICMTPDKKYMISDNSSLQTAKISFWNIQIGVIDYDYSFKVNAEVTSIAVSRSGKWLAVSYTRDNALSASEINLFEMTGIGAYDNQSFTDNVMESSGSGFGSSIRYTTPKTPLIEIGQKRVIAVINLDNIGLTDDVAKTATYLLESKLGNNDKVVLTERNQVEKLVAEMQYQQSGMTTSDVVSLGEQLNANYILTGSLNKLGNTIILSIKLINIETAQIIGTREVQCDNATVEDIPDMIMLIAPSIVK